MKIIFSIKTLIMRSHKLYLLLTLLSFIGSIYAQSDQKKIDSLYSVYNSSNDDSVKISALNFLSFHYERSGFDYAQDSAIATIERALSLLKRKNVRHAFNFPYIQAYRLYLQKSKYDNAIETLLNYYDVAKQINKVDWEGDALSMLVGVFATIKDYEKAQDYASKLETIVVDMKDFKMKSEAYNHLGTYYKDINQNEKALKFHQEALDIRVELGFKSGVAHSYNNIGIVYKNIQDYENAITYYKKSLEIKEQLGDKKGIAGSNINIANVYMLNKQPKQGLKYVKKGLQLAEEANALQFKTVGLDVLYNIEKALGNYAAALDAYERAVELKNEVYNKQVIEQAKELEKKYESEKKDQELIILQQEADIKDLEMLKQQESLSKQKNIIWIFSVSFAVVLVLVLFIMRSVKQKQKMNTALKEQNSIIRNQKQQVEDQKLILEIKNKEITGSINYAKRIQSAILPPDRMVLSELPNSAILYKPKDIIAGDFYWLESFVSTKVGTSEFDEIIGDSEIEVSNSEQVGEKENSLGSKHVLIAVADCTGHGVPGAMVSVVCNNALNRSVREYKLSDPGKILDKTRDIVVEELGKSDDNVKDGMDISLLSIQQTEHDIRLKWAGANSPLWIIRRKTLHTKQEGGHFKVSEIPGSEFVIIEYKPDKQPVGRVDNPKPFSTHEIVAQREDTVFLFTDGFADQFGGSKQKKLKSSGMKELFVSVQNRPVKEQLLHLNQVFENWKSDVEQVDDVCIIGIRF
jgi:tetratricopeptide (TPR) repeat protein